MKNYNSLRLFSKEVTGLNAHDIYETSTRQRVARVDIDGRTARFVDPDRSLEIETVIELVQMIKDMHEDFAATLPDLENIGMRKKSLT